MTRAAPETVATMTPAQRRAAVAELLARAIIRLHQRGALKNPTTTPPDAANRLDSLAEMPLSVSRDHHNG